MATKVKDLDQAKKLATKAKNALLEAKKELTDFLKKNKLSRDEDHSKDKKFGKEFKALNLEVEKANAAMDEANETVANFKPAKASKGGGAGKATKYDYPEGLTPEEKKKFRIQARKGDKPAKAAKDKAAPAKKDKKTTKTEKEVTKTTVKSKKGKKGGKGKKSNND
jgi:hypothetical protein